jgi:hypothetical protein
MYFGVGRQVRVLSGVMAAFALALAGVRGADDTAADWEKVLELPPPPEGKVEAFPRWMSALEALPTFTMLDDAALQAVPDEPPEEAVFAHFRALARRTAAGAKAFTLESDERPGLPPGYGMGRGLPGPDEWMKLARLKTLQVRVNWWTERRATATAAAADLIRIGTAAARESMQMRDWVTWMQVATAGFDAARWIARQVDVTDDELAALGRALAESAGAWPEGAVSALRGEFAFSFRGAVEHIPETTDVIETLEALADFGLPRLPAEAGAEDLAPLDQVLMDHGATLALYGEAIAKFIRTVTSKPIWQQSVFGAELERNTELWLADVGIFGELALKREQDEYPAEQLPAIRAALAHAPNPVGKLFVVYGATNFDAIAFEGLRVEAERRCTRLLVEWRRRILRFEELPASAEAWEALGIESSALEDPFTGGPLFFDPENLRVWSVGPDGVSNHGSGNVQVDLDGADLWWTLAPRDDE